MSAETLSLEQLPPLVLVVDDDSMLRNLLKEVLSKEGYRVATAVDGEDALRQLDEQPADLVITDVVMPGMSGVDVLRNARRRYPDIDVIVMTGYASVDTAIRSIRLGAVDYITKPFNIDHIRALVAKTIEISRLNRIQRSAEEASASAGVDISTGLYNRRLFLDLVQGELNTANRTGQPMSLIIVELIDAYQGGTSQPDASHWQEWLTLVSWSLRRNARPSDRIGRLGPTTFGVGLPDIDSISVLAEQDRLIDLVLQELRMKTSAVAVKSGSSTFPQDAEDLNSLLHIAEQQCRTPLAQNRFDR